MPKLIGSPATITNAQQQRDIFRIEVEVHANDTYTLRGHGKRTLRDGNGVTVLADPTVETVVIEHAALPLALRNGIAALIARLDTL